MKLARQFYRGLKHPYNPKGLLGLSKWSGIYPQLSRLEMTRYRRACRMTDRICKLEGRLF